VSALHVQRRKGEGPPAILFTSVVGRGRRKVPLRALGAIRDDKTVWGGVEEIPLATNLDKSANLQPLLPVPGPPAGVSHRQNLDFPRRSLPINQGKRKLSEQKPACRMRPAAQRCGARVI
jgi:hypothetical protein